MNATSVPPAYSSHSSYASLCPDPPEPSLERVVVDHDTVLGCGQHDAGKMAYLGHYLAELRERYGCVAMVLVEVGVTGWPLVRFVGTYAQVVNLLMREFHFSWEETKDRIGL